MGEERQVCIVRVGLRQIGDCLLGGLQRLLVEFAGDLELAFQCEQQVVQVAGGHLPRCVDSLIGHGTPPACSKLNALPGWYYLNLHAGAGVNLGPGV